MGRRVVTTSQPQYPAQIDWSNPITRGLGGCFLPHIQFNLADGVPLLALGTPQAVGSSIGLVSNGLGGFGYPRPASSNSTEAKFDLQILSALCFSSNGANNSYSFCRSNGSSAPGWFVSQQDTSSGLNGARAGIGSFIFNETAPKEATLLPAVVCITADGSTAKVYRNGALRGEGSYSAATYQISPSSSRGVNFGPLTQGGLSVSTKRCPPALGLFWNRAISENEVKSISANPWQVFL